MAHESAQRSRDASAMFDDLQVPELSPYKIFKEGTREAQADTAFDDIREDYGAIQQQRQAAQGLFDIYDQGGYTAAEQAQIRQAGRQAARQEQAQRGAIMQQAAARGIAGSGFEMASQLAAQQGSADRLAQQADAISIAGQQRAMQALGMGGQMATTMRGQQLGREMGRATAQDRINAANAAYRQGVALRNVERDTMQSAQANQLRQQNFANQMAARGARSSATLGSAQGVLSSASLLNQMSQQQIGNIMGGINMGLNVLKSAASGGMGAGIQGALG